LEEFRSDDAGPLFIRLSAANGEFERVVGSAGVAIGKGRDAEEDFVGSFYGFISETMDFVLQGATKEFCNLRRSEWIENVHLSARKQRRDNLKGRILRSCANKDDVASLDMRQKSILLGFIKA